MAFSGSKSQRGRELSDLPDDWVGWLEPGIELEGKMKVGSGLIRLNAQFKGELTSEGTVVIHDQGEVEGDIHARLISVTGKVKGNLHASERLEIKQHGVVLGDIYTSSLVIEPGGFFDGQCHMPTQEATSVKAQDTETRGQP